MTKINFRTGDRPFVFPNKTGLKQFIASIFKKEKKQPNKIRDIAGQIKSVHEPHLAHRQYVVNACSTGKGNRAVPSFFNVGKFLNMPDSNFGTK